MGVLLIETLRCSLGEGGRWRKFFRRVSQKATQILYVQHEVFEASKFAIQLLGDPAMGGAWHREKYARERRTK